MQRRMTLVSLAALLALLCCGSASFAKEQACRAEMDKFCKDVAVGSGRVLKCLQDHESDLSDACKAYVNTASQYMACMDDVLRLCPGTEPGGSRGMKCLRMHQTDLSTECKNELGKHRR
ncbi:MAG TPA: cysteine rich repeat-containing protein [Candidatus Acidoferrales bacterium]|nr:cysteine rich repeat-containing protein [Candidatus Acidoferrales bacterium]